MPDRRSESHQERLGRHLEDLLSRTPEAPPPREGAGLLEGLAAPRARHRREDLAGLAHELARGRAGRAAEASTEAIIIPDLRPVLDVQDGTFPEPGPYFPELAACRDRVEAALGAVGRIDVVGLAGLEYVGTGFVVGAGVLMTNRHVAEMFTAGLGGEKRLRFLPGIVPSVDLGRELDREAAVVLAVVKPLLVHPFWDMALLQVKGAGRLRPLRLLATAPGTDVAPVAAIGYPAFDPRNETDVQMKVFRGTFGVKRLQPGYTKGSLETISYGHPVEALGHDCSTLGGNSGSCVLDVRTGVVVGLHFGGAYLEANYAVPAWELARDARVVDAGVGFGGKAVPGPPPWKAAWAGLERPTPGAGPAAPPRERPVEWYERTGPDALRAEWQADPAGCAARLERAAGPVDARAARARLAEGRGESLFARRTDPDALEVLFLHGILGAHLDTPDGRTWLDVERILLGDIAGRLALEADGVTDAWRGPPASPGPHLKLKYQRAASAWRDEGLVVHPFSYDWRKPVEVEAERLHGFVETLDRERPGRKDRRFLLVAHSMGGLVAAAWAAVHPEWSERIARAALLGSPLRGSFAPFEAIRGTYPVFRKLADVSLRNSLADLQAMARTLSGLVDMLPDPAVFPDAGPMYSDGVWESPFAPAPDLLERSRRLKAKLASSPLLERTVALVSVAHGTASSVADAKAGRRVGPGDGTVPIASAAPRGVAAYLARSEHSDLPRDPLAIGAVLQLARGQEPTLERLTDAHRTGPVSQAEAIVRELATYDGRRAPEVRGRLAEGRLDGSDVDWLLSSGFDVADRGAEQAGGPAAGSTVRWAAPAAEAAPARAEGPAFREFQLGGPFGVGDPVHETITLVGLEAAGYPEENREQILRGVFWNDDPECLLFDDGDPSRPFVKSTGLLFAVRFKSFELFASGKRPIEPQEGLLGRSHFGDLQYLHAMASFDREARARTLGAMLGWAEFCWEVALGNVLPGATRDRWGSQSGMFPSAGRYPENVAALFSCRPELVPFRALGSLCHLVEDSYAGGHAERVAIDATRRGKIRRFFCYTSQDHAQHAELDRWHGGKTTAQKLGGLPGAQDAADRVKRLAELYMERAEWPKLRTWLSRIVWATTRD
ncbi:MAG TPA: trypsin-like peptidase domain-containing protein [Anaeromyxobacteraceae bacterium]